MLAGEMLVEELGGQGSFGTVVWNPFALEETTPEVVISIRRTQPSILMLMRI